MNSIYNSYFFNEFYAKNGGGNYTNREQWEPFFSNIADKIIERFNPRTVLDAGCATGYLVEALRNRGIEAYGFDISEYAINNTSEDIKPFCIVHSILDPLPDNFPQEFDLIITLEVLEHLFPEEGRQALGNLCKYTDKIIFSSTPNDIDDRTHVNVQLGEYWAKLFAENSFYRDLIQPLDFICPWAMLFERKENDFSNIVFNYELNMRINQSNIDTNEKQLLGRLYYDQGEGFNEENSLEIEGVVNFGDFHQKFDIPENTVAVRFDPVENKACVLHNLQVISDNGALELSPINGEIIKDFIVFNKFDPQVLISFQNKIIKWIEIKTAILAYEDISSISMLSQFMDISNLEHDLINKNEIINQKEEELLKNRGINQELIKVKDQEITLISKQLEEKDQEITLIFKQFEEKDQEITLLSKQLEEKDEEVHQLRLMFDTISTSTFWKITKPFRVILDFIKKKVKTKKKIDQIELTKNIESFKFDNNILTVDGWLFSQSSSIENLYLKIVYNKKEYRVEMAYGLERKDVEKNYPNENARYSGFSSTALIENCSRFDVYLEYMEHGEKKELFIGEIFAPSSKFVFLKQKLNKQNIYKLISYLRHKRMDIITAAIKRPRINAITSSSIPLINLPEWLEKNTTNRPDYPASIYNETIDIVIPVYNGYEYFDKLFNSIKGTKMKYRLLIVNDNSPDERVSVYLKELAAHDPKVVLLENEENIGFVQSVNKALRETKNHVALLNTDIELPEYWLERLMMPILTEKKVASSTPFTNSGTLCSFPNIGKDNTIFESMTCIEVDKAFQYINPTYIELPTGVGFCMGMNKFVLKEIGLFDEETFSKGYGEENDWCQRAIINGYKNVIVENLFVYHKHGGSFLSEEKKRLIERNGKLLSKKHPTYNAHVASFFEIDPLKNIRDFAIMKLLADLDGKKPLLAFDHNIGGGASAYLDNLRKDKIRSADKMIVIRYDLDNQLFMMRYYYKEYELAYRFVSFADIEKIINIIGVSEIYINELVTYPNLYEILGQIISLKKKFGAKLIMLLHDYFPICPTINLLDDKQSYCNIPDLKRCESCLKNNPFNSYWQYESMEKWRREWNILIDSCNQIVAFSNSSAELLQKSYGKLENLTIIPHQVNYIPKLKKQHRSSEALNIGLIGILNFHKGLEVIREILNLIDSKKLKINITLLGSSEGAVQHPNFRETGKYRPESLPRLVLENNIDLFFISSIWPETFSYTTEEAMKMGLPVAVFDLGAPAERVRNYEKGLVISKIDAGAAINEIIEFSKNWMNKTPTIPSKQKVLFIAEYVSFSSRYRVEHFMEQLLVQGVNSDFIEVKDVGKYNAKDYHSIVIYRCAYSEKLATFIEQAHTAGKLVFYDIDDYIFEYGEIKTLPFLSGEDYLDFESYSNRIYKCMALCDGFFTSTNNLYQAIKKCFPNKLVCVNRNVASMEMVSLSNNAKLLAGNNGHKVVLGYFSGSKTHDGDFAIINKVLINIMNKYDNVHLKIGGCLNLDEEFKNYKDRVSYFDFVDWRKLPNLVASVDINLMPLEDSFFHACKSENKWMEAALVEVPTIASRNSELETIIENGVTGFLCSNEMEWEHNLELLINSKELRDRMSKAANKKVSRDYVTTNTGEQAKNTLLGEFALSQ